MFLDPQASARFAIGVWIASFSAGGAIGPLVGGLLAGPSYWWGSVFLVGVPVMILLLAVGPWLLPEYKDPNAGRLDLVSAAMSLVAVLAVIFGIKRIAEHGMGALAWGPIGAGILVGVLFVARQKRLADPLIDFRLFRSPAFSAAVAVNVLGFSVAFGSFLLIAQYLQLVLGMTALEAGLWTAPSAFGFIAGSMIAPRLTRALRPAYVMTGGLLTSAAGFALLTQIGGPNGLAVVVVGYVILSLGMAPVVTLTTDLIVGAAPPEKAGSAAAISETGAEFGGAVGIAVLGSIVTAIYRSQMALTQPGGLAPDAARTAAATLGGAVAEAARLPADLAASLLAAARAAFVAGMQLSALVATVGLIVTAVIAVVLLRRVPAAAAHPA
jgi:DHA2 family multidrug resistance protein-like MFS transporter